MRLPLLSSDLQVVQDLLLAALPLSVEKLLDDGQTLEAHVHGWTAGQKPLRIGMLWMGKDILHRAPFHDFSIVHYCHIVGDFGHHT